MLRSVRLDDLDIRMGAGEGPGLREIPMLPEVVQAGPLEIELRHLRAAARPLRLRRRGPRHARRGVRTRGHPSSRPGRDGRDSGAERIAIDVQAVREKLERVEAEARIAPTRIDVRSLGATWEGRRANSAGRVDGPFDAPRVDVTVRGEVDVAAVGARAKSPWALAGLVRVNGRLEGPIESPKVSADVAFDELAAGPVKARAGAARLALADGA